MPRPHRGVSHLCRTAGWTGAVHPVHIGYRARVPDRYEFRAAPLVKASYALEGDAIVYRQGVRRIAIPLAQVRGFAIRERPAFMKMPASALTFRIDGRRKPRSTVFDPSSPACRDFLAALRARLPAADLTALPWPEAAAKLGVVARPWYEGFLQPRVTLGVLMLGANAAASSMTAKTHDRAELLGQGIAMLAVTIVAVYLIITGVRRGRRDR